MVKKIKKKWPVIVPLKHPVKITRDEEEKEISELKLRQFKAKHLKHIPAEPESAYFLVPLIAALSNIDEEEAQEIDIEDIFNIQETLLPFLGAFPGIGKK